MLPPELYPEEDRMFVDWATFWDRDRHEADWVFDDVLARGRGHALYARHKAGKSLLALFIAARAATRPGTLVVYLDYEMTEDDLFERLVDMGYGPDIDLSRLRYASLPSLPALDSPEGGRALGQVLDAEQARHPDAHLVVVIDTTGRALQGEENDADTVRDFYRWTGLSLKQRGATWLRLDHAGKDSTKGQRGSSAKGDDVDVVWRMDRTDSGLTLHRDASRMSWVPERVTFQRLEDPLRYAQVAAAWIHGTAECAALLDGLRVPLDASTNDALAALRNAGTPKRKTVVLAAMRYRKSAE